ncbi:MAG: hypothetical protein AAFO07_19795 [Bacteroidota bacterium]
MKNKSLSGLFVFVFLMLCGFNVQSQAIELEGDPNTRIFHLDSIGNIIDYKKALELMRTGEYVSIPQMNSSMEIEQLIRKRDPNNPIDQQNQVYTDGGIVVNTFKASKFMPKLSMGDTLPAISAQNVLGESIWIGKNQQKQNSILILTDKTTWGQMRQNISQLIKRNPSVDFLIVPTGKRQSLDNFFSNGFLKSYDNVFIAKDIQGDFLNGDEQLPVYYSVDPTGKIVFLIPPLKKPEIATIALQRYLDRMSGK